MSAKVYNGIIYKDIRKGRPFSLRFRVSGFPTFFEQYTAIRCDFKSKKSLDDPYVFSLSLGNGIALEGGYLVFRLTAEMTRGIRHPKLYADAKAESTGNEPDDLFELESNVLERTTP